MDRHPPPGAFGQRRRRRPPEDATETVGHGIWRGHCGGSGCGRPAGKVVPPIVPSAAPLSSAEEDCRMAKSVCHGRPGRAVFPRRCRCTHLPPSLLSAVRRTAGGPGRGRRAAAACDRPGRSARAGVHHAAAGHDRAGAAGTAAPRHLRRRRGRRLSGRLHHDARNGRGRRLAARHPHLHLVARISPQPGRPHRLRMGPERGRELAGVVLAQKQAQPNLPVSLVGHSAGSFVVLVAAEQLPPDTLERIVLLSPSVSSGYDIRPALHAARDGMDVFYSKNDRVWLGLLHGAGRHVRRRPAKPPSRPFRLRAEARPWRGAAVRQAAAIRMEHVMEQVGNDGGHYGAYQPGHLRRFVLRCLSITPVRTVCREAKALRNGTRQIVHFSSAMKPACSKWRSAVRASVIPSLHHDKGNAIGQ